jgi:hypothetical protein
MDAGNRDLEPRLGAKPRTRGERERRIPEPTKVLEEGVECGQERKGKKACSGLERADVEKQQ